MAYRNLKMTAKGSSIWLEREAKSAPMFQEVREFVFNSIQQFALLEREGRLPKNPRIHAGICYPVLEASARSVEEDPGNVSARYARCFMDNAGGIDSEDLVETISGMMRSGKPMTPEEALALGLDPTDLSHGVGARLMSAVANGGCGVYFISFHETCPDGMMVCLARDPQTGAYGLREMKEDPNDEHSNEREMIPPPVEIRDDFFRVMGKKATGLYVVCMGDDIDPDHTWQGVKDSCWFNFPFPKQNTMLEWGQYTGEDSRINLYFQVRWLSRYLCNILWDVPDYITITVDEFKTVADRSKMPRFRGDTEMSRNGNKQKKINIRHVSKYLGRNLYEKWSSEPGGASGVINTPKAKIHWYLLGEETTRAGAKGFKSTHSYAINPGRILTRFHDEIVDTPQGVGRRHYGDWQRFGLRGPLTKRLLLVVEFKRYSGKGSSGIIMTTNRSSVRWVSARYPKDMSEVWDEVCLFFKENLPDPIKAEYEKWQNEAAASFGDMDEVNKSVNEAADNQRKMLNKFYPSPKRSSGGGGGGGGGSKAKAKKGYTVHYQEEKDMVEKYGERGSYDKNSRELVIFVNHPEIQNQIIHYIESGHRPVVTDYDKAAVEKVVYGVCASMLIESIDHHTFLNRKPVKGKNRAYLDEEYNVFAPLKNAKTIAEKVKHRLDYLLSKEASAVVGDSEDPAS